MISINKAALHLFDIPTNSLILSEGFLELTEATIQYLISHIEKNIKKQSAKQGTFLPDSAFQILLNDYIADNIDFLDFSKKIAQKWSDLLKQTAELPASDFLLCHFTVDEIPYLAIFRTTNKLQFVHQISVNESGETHTSIVQNAEFLPQPNQSIDEFAFINLQTTDVTISAKRFSLDGNMIHLFSEALLECDLTPSPTETIKAMEKTAEQVANSFSHNPVQAASSVKAAIAEELEHNDTLSPLETASSIFPDQPALQQAYQEELRKKGFEDTQAVKIEKEPIVKKIINHKLKTDTGIELSIPVEYFDSTEFLEFQKTENGTMTITLKNISNIMNRIS